MKKIIVLVAALLISVSVLLLVLAPDTLSMIVVGCMWIAVILGSFLGLFPSILYANAFRTAKNNLEQTMAVQTTENWIAVFKLDSLFHQKELDRVFSEYKLKVLMQKEAKEILSGIEEYISEDALRYQENTVVDTISIGSDGIGRSQELFLGSYLVRQTGIPEYYGKVAAEKLVILKTRSDSKQREAVTLYEEKTSMEIALVDELFESIPLAGASLSLRSADGEVLQQLTTNAQGKAVLRNLKKNTTYYLRQESAPDGYRMNLKDLSFRVSSDGFIDGSVSAARTITNRTLRISVAVQDKLFRSYVSDVNLVLMDAEGNILKNWSSTGLEQRFDGIGQGQYKLVMGGDVDGAVTITVEDTAEIQEFRLERWTTTDIAVLVSAAALAVGGLVLLVWLLRRRKGNKEGGDA